MKKVLSVMLAAAMVMGMSVSGFAAKFYAEGSSDETNHINANEISWDQVVIINKHGKWEDTLGTDKNYDELNAGDDMYFRMNIEGAADKDWVVKVNEEEFVEDIVFFYEDDLKVELPKDVEHNTAYVKVTIADDFDHYAEDGKTNFWFYVYDTNKYDMDENDKHVLDANGKKVVLTEEQRTSEKATVKYSFDDYAVVYLCSDECTKDYEAKDRDNVKCETIGHEDEAHAAVKLGKTDPVMYVLCDCGNCFTTSQKVMFEVELNEKEVFFQAKMIPGEEYMTTIYTKFDKALTKEYDVDMNVLHIDTELKVDAIFESAKDNKVVLEVVDGELYEVETEFVEKYEVTKGELTKGYKVTNIENGAFVIVDEDADLEWEDTTRKEVVEAPVADDKANPSTGANDFVGAAVALAVVSVAAAGALAFKK